MSIFGTIMNKVFHHGAAAADAGAAPTSTPAAETSSEWSNTTTATVADGSTAAAPSVIPASSAPAPSQPVDVEAVCTAMAAQKGGASDWQHSIVDLLKLLDMDSSLAARKELANELDVHVGADGTAEENIALHKAVMAKLAENGGHVPASLRG